MTQYIKMFYHGECLINLDHVANIKREENVIAFLKSNGSEVALFEAPNSAYAQEKMNAIISYVKDAEDRVFYLY